MRWKRWTLGVGVGLAALSLYVWPARRNFYGKLGGVDERLDVPYAGTDDPKQRLDLFLPRDAPRPFPVVVFVHGGYWSPLDRRWLEPLLGTFGNVGGAFARHGIGAAVIGYRQYPQVKKGDDSLDDIARAVGFVESMASEWGGDPARVFVMGHSAGGHLVALLGMDERILRRNAVTRDPAGYVSVDGVFDLETSLPYFKTDQQEVMRTLFGPDLAASSPITYGVTHPMLFVDSTSDEAVCRDQFGRMRSKLGSAAEFVELPGLGHNEMIVRMGTDDERLLAVVTAFITRTRP